MRLDAIRRPLARWRTNRSFHVGLSLILSCLVLSGCASGSATNVRVDQSRDAGLKDQLAAEQATRTVKRFFPPTGTPSPTEPPAPALSDLVITFGFRPDGTPDGSYESVPAGSGTVYAAARLTGVAEGQVIRAVVTDAWGNDVAAPEVRIDPGAADRWIALPIGLGAELAAGEYGVFLFSDDRTLGSLAFGVSGPGSSAQLLPELPPNPQVRSTLPPPGSSGVETAVTPTIAPSA